MASEYSIDVGVTLDTSTIQPQLDSGNYKINLSGATFAGTPPTVDLQANINLGKGTLQSFTQVRDATGDVVKQVTNVSRGIGVTTTNVKTLDKATGQLATTQSKVTTNYAEQQKLANRFNQTLGASTQRWADTSTAGLQNFAQQMNSISGTSVKFAGSMQYAGQEYQLFTKNVNAGNGAVTTSQIAINKTTGAVHELDTGLKQVNKSGDTMGNVLGKIAKWAVMTAMIYTPIQKLKEAITEMKAVDSELVNIQKVTGATRTEMDALAESAYSTASAYGRTASDVLSSTTEFARAGHGSRASELAEVAILTQNVGDVEANTANKFLLAADAAWKMGGSTEKLTRVLDGLNEISNKNATDVSKLAEGISVAGSVFANSGEDIGTYAAMLGTATAVTQESGNKMARGLRTIAMRIQQVQGETEDGEIIDAESISNAAKALASVGIDNTKIVNGNQELKTTSEVLGELAGKWDTLSSMQQSYIKEALAGKMQSNVFTSVVENWDMVQKMMGEYANSAGSALKENEIYLDSWEAKTNQLKATWTEFVAKSLSSDMFKGFLDGATGLLDFIGNLENALTMILGVILLVKAEKISNWIMALGGNFKNIGNYITNVIPGLKSFNTTLSATGTTAATTGSALQGALGIFGMAMMLFSAVQMAVDNANQKAEEARQAAIDSGKAAIESVSEIRDLYNEYQNLKNGYENGTTSSEAFQSSVDTLCGKLGIEAQAVSNLADGYSALDASIRKAMDSRMKAAQYEIDAAIHAAGQKLHGETGIFGALSPNISIDDKYWDIVSGSLDGWGFTNPVLGKYLGTPTDAEGSLQYYEALSNAITDLEKKATKLKESGDIAGAEAIYDSAFYKKMKEVVADARGPVEEYANMLAYDLANKTKSNGVDTQKDFDEAIGSIEGSGGSTMVKSAAKELIESWYPQFASAATEVTQEKAPIKPKTLADLKGTSAQDGISQATELQERYQELEGAIAQAYTEGNSSVKINALNAEKNAVGANIDVYREYLQTLHDAGMSNYAEGFAATTKAIEEQASAGVITQETYDGLIAANFAYAETCTHTANGIRINKEAASALTEEMRQNKLAQLALEKSELQQKMSDMSHESLMLGGNTEEVTKAYQEQIKHIEELEYAYGNITKNVEDFNKATSTEDFGLSKTLESAYDVIKQTKKSGNYGTDDYKSAADFFGFGDADLDMGYIRKQLDKVADAYNNFTKKNGKKMRDWATKNGIWDIDAKTGKKKLAVTAEELREAVAKSMKLNPSDITDDMLGGVIEKLQGSFAGLDFTPLKNQLGEAGESAKPLASGMAEIKNQADAAKTAVAGAKTEAQNLGKVTVGDIGLGSAIGSASKLANLLQLCIGRLAALRSGGYSTGVIGNHADGTQNSPGEIAFVNEGTGSKAGPEIIKSGDEAYIAGDGQPTMTHLKPGDRVIPAEQTRRILKGIRPGMSKKKGVKINAYASGKGDSDDVLKKFKEWQTIREGLIDIIESKQDLSITFKDWSKYQSRQIKSWTDVQKKAQEKITELKKKGYKNDSEEIIYLEKLRLDAEKKIADLRFQKFEEYASRATDIIDSYKTAMDAFYGNDKMWEQLNNKVISHYEKIVKQSKKALSEMSDDEKTMDNEKYRAIVDEMNKARKAIDDAKRAASERRSAKYEAASETAGNLKKKAIDKGADPSKNKWAKIELANQRKNIAELKKRAALEKEISGEGSEEHQKAVQDLIDAQDKYNDTLRENLELEQERLAGQRDAANAMKKRAAQQNHPVYADKWAKIEQDAQQKIIDKAKERVELEKKLNGAGSAEHQKAVQDLIDAQDKLLELKRETIDLEKNKQQARSDTMEGMRDRAAKKGNYADAQKWLDLEIATQQKLLEETAKRVALEKEENGVGSEEHQKAVQERIAAEEKLLELLKWQHEQQMELIRAEKELSEARQDSYGERDIEATSKWVAEEQLQIANLRKQISSDEAELARLLAAGYSEDSEEVRKLRKEIQDLNNEVQQSIDEIDKRLEDELLAAMEKMISDAALINEERNKSYDRDISKIKTLIDLETARFNLTKSIKSEQISIANELEKAKKLYPTMTDEERKTLFNQEQYEALSKKLSSLENENQQIYADYYQKISSLTTDNVWQAEFITKEFQAQYDAKLKEYAVVKAEFAVANAQAKLNNAYSQKTWKILKDGQWQWVENLDAVEAAMDEMTSAQQSYSDTMDDLNQQILNNALNMQINSLEYLKAAAEQEEKALSDALKKIKALLENPARDIEKILLDIAKNGTPEFKREILAAAGDITQFDEGLQAAFDAIKKSLEEANETTEDTNDLGDALDDAAKDVDYFALAVKSATNALNNLRFIPYIPHSGSGGEAGSFDSGGIAYGKGYLKKDTNSAEGVIRPGLLGKIIDPQSSAQWDKFTSDVEWMLDASKNYGGTTAHTIGAAGGAEDNSMSLSIGSINIEQCDDAQKLLSEVARRLPNAMLQRVASRF